MITIRQATPEDIPQIDLCNRSILSENYPPIFYNTLFALENWRRVVLIAEENDDVFCGYIIALMKKDKMGRIYAYVVSFGIYEQHRRKKCGTLLQQKLEKSVAGHVYYISLHVRKNNRIAQSFYTRQGYSRGKKVKNYYEDNEDAFLMKKFC